MAICLLPACGCSLAAIFNIIIRQLLTCRVPVNDLGDSRTAKSGSYLARWYPNGSPRIPFKIYIYIGVMIGGFIVFPAGVGPGSPSRDAANWLPSRFSLSVETRRRYGWLRMMVFPGARLFPSPNLGPFGRVAARERQGALSRRAW